jgi:3'(2'), 5'-bisphosphate nucleotidase
MKDIFEKILKDCGEQLLSLSESSKGRGSWQGEQFKAEADFLAHKFLQTKLENYFSQPVVSEEDSSSQRDKTNREYILIDPIDGTASFSHGFSGWVTQAAYMVDEIPVFGAVYAPALGLFYSAELNKGSFLNGKKLLLEPPSDKFIHSIIDNYPMPKGVTKEIVDSLQIPNYIESGSIGLKICRIADRTAELFFKAMNPRDWDLAAPQIILKEAGGLLTDIHGKSFAYGNNHREHEGLIAAPSSAILRRVVDWYEDYLATKKNS